MTDESEDEGLPPPLSGELRWNGSLMPMSDRRTGESDPVRETRLVLSQKAQTGDPTLVVDALIAGPESCAYWREVALELHAQGEHYEALHAWQRSKKAVRAGDDHYDPESVGIELWNASGFGDDSYLAEKASQEFKAAGQWDRALHISQVVGTSGESLLAGIWDALEAGGCPDEDGEWDLEGVCIDWIAFANVTDWHTMGLAHLMLGNMPEALEAWARMVRSDTTDESLLSMISALVEEARRRGHEYQAFLP
jgi:hypothetical protein